jgi:hypothetical protein
VDGGNTAYVRRSAYAAMSRKTESKSAVMIGEAEDLQALVEVAVARVVFTTSVSRPASIGLQNG